MPEHAPAPSRRPVRRRPPAIATRRNAFAARLLLTLALTLLILGGAQYWVVSAEFEQTFVRAGTAMAQDDARSIEAAYGRPHGQDPFGEVAEAIAVIGGRAHVNGVFLVDQRGIVVQSHDPAEIGEVETENVGLVQGGGTYAGPSRREDDGADTFEYVWPVRLDGALHALEIDVDGGAFRHQLEHLRRNTLALMIAGFVLAVPLFYLLGGRRLARLHHVAVSRATRDGLTDLGNQTSFQEELRRAAAHAIRSAEPLSVAVVDLDDFKVANDRNGHRAGDVLLTGVAELLADGSPGLSAFRIGGDEFALLMPGTDASCAERHLETVRTAAAGRLGGVTFSSGVAELDPEASDAGSVVEQADAALYEAKRRGRDRTVRFDDLDETLVVTAARIRALHALLVGAPVEVAFQPIWELHDARNRLVGFEALARPQVPELLEVGEAFEVAERIGRAHELDALCRRATLARASELPPGVLLFLNVSPQSLDHDELAGDALARAVRAAGLEPSRVVLEITERSVARLDRVVREATRLRALGFKLALDDVGAGNAGLEMLRSLPVDFVKIDRGVVSASSAGGSARAVLHAVVSFAAEVGAFVIAEGIESEEMLAHVRRPARRNGTDRRTGVQGAQGYLLGRPSVSLPVDEASAAA
ncbi:MAG: diguanylate cyclase/phosphodiesterase (GGDEF & EAL domains) with PAS/PAC sensor(s) [uncultured Thermoleophilia bacterium]|uniref:Diguanylate cyclase/phosphodiesterase (GGDEF & EAL domains) with PAS/PAC sensor(S) n=1 Tax=uncultured Thermoleophilia bacterium TaxID=1497501 RepID=A0A6J4TJW5_9ACTN|nr:MAG: diguanylate cyclase/phosphodiesterase (GGDEF & EAL domains) with PAS/PAC sensor(s) [uncultured Thermoleophilia bacterium]